MLLYWKGYYAGKATLEFATLESATLEFATLESATLEFATLEKMPILIISQQKKAPIYGACGGMEQPVVGWSKR